jgi:DNA-directed RNA polymerase subunit RPC12/RpoP
MSGTGKTIGIILVMIGVLIGLVAALFFSSGVVSGRATASAMILGFGLVFVVVVLPLVGVGGFLFVKGRQDAAAFAEVEKEKKVLNMVLSQGQVRVSEVALELNATRDQVKEWVYDLVGKGLFTGYIKWDEGVLYSKQASELKTNKCPNCGGQLELAGKGVVSCPYCGTEIFL